MCALASAALLCYGRLRPAGGVSVVVRYDSPVIDADRARAEGHRRMKAGEFAAAGECYRKAIGIYRRLREEHGGAEYAWLDDEIAMANVFLRTAREHAFTGNALPVPE